MAGMAKLMTSAEMPIIAAQIKKTRPEMRCHRGWLARRVVLNWRGPRIMKRMPGMMWISVRYG